MQITEKTVAIVTGGASGLGAATATALATHGAKVTIFDMNLDFGEQKAAEIGAEFKAVDVSDASQVADAVKAVEAAHSSLHILINCAGIGGSLGHPKVYLDMGDLNEIRCPYCSKLFILENS